MKECVISHFYLPKDEESQLSWGKDENGKQKNIFQTMKYKAKFRTGPVPQDGWAVPDS